MKRERKPLAFERHQQLGVDLTFAKQQLQQLANELFTAYGAGRACRLAMRAQCLVANLQLQMQLEAARDFPTGDRAEIFLAYHPGEIVTPETDLEFKPHPRG